MDCNTEFTQRDPIGPDDVVSDQAAAVSSVQTGSLDLRRVPPVSPINKAGQEKKYIHVKQGGT